MPLQTFFSLFFLCQPKTVLSSCLAFRDAFSWRCLLLVLGRQRYGSSPLDYFFAPLVVIVKKTAKSLRLARALNCASHHPYCRSLAKTTKWSRFIYFLRIFCKANLLFFEKWLDKSFPFLQKLTIWQCVKKTCRKVVKWCLLVPLLEISSLWLDAK